MGKRKSSVSLENFLKQSELLDKVIEIDLGAIKKGATIEYGLTPNVVETHAKREEDAQKELMKDMKKLLNKKGINVSKNNDFSFIVNHYIDKIGAEEYQKEQFNIKLQLAEDFLYSHEVVEKEEVIEFFKKNFKDFYLNKYNDFVISILDEYEAFIKEFAITPR